MENERPLPHILFNTHTARAFRTTLIFNLFEIAQHYPVTLLSEEMDPETEALIRDKTLFPKIERIIPVRQFSGQDTNLFSKTRTRELKKLAKQTIADVQPDIIFASNDVYLFELFLFRYGKKSLKISLQSTVVWEKGDWALLLRLTRAHLHMWTMLPLRLRTFIVRAGKLVKHYYYYYILPIRVISLPFYVGGGSSIFKNVGSDGKRAVDYKIVFSKHDEKIHIDNKVPEKRLRVMSHPLLHPEARKFFLARMAYAAPQKAEKRTVTISIPAESIQFDRKTYAATGREELFKHRTEVVGDIAKTLADWQVLVTIHPSSGDIPRYESVLPTLAPNIQFDNFYKPFDEYVSVSEIVIGFPPASTTLFTASLQSPEKAILYLDFKHELTGRRYENFPGIDYISSKDKLIQILLGVKNGTYSKKLAPKEQSDFADTDALIKILYRPKS